MISGHLLSVKADIISWIRVQYDFKFAKNNSISFNVLSKNKWEFLYTIVWGQSWQAMLHMVLSDKDYDISVQWYVLLFIKSVND